MLGSMKLVCSGLANRITMRRVENTASDLPPNLFVFLFYLPCSPCCWTLPPFRSGLFRAASWGGFFVNLPSFPSQRDRKRGGMEKQKAVVDETRLQRAQKDCRLELEGQGKQGIDPPLRDKSFTAADWGPVGWVCVNTRLYYCTIWWLFPASLVRFLFFFFLFFRSDSRLTASCCWSVSSNSSNHMIICFIVRNMKLSSLGEGMFIINVRFSRDGINR